MPLFFILHLSWFMCGLCCALRVFGISICSLFFCVFGLTFACRITGLAWGLEPLEQRNQKIPKAKAQIFYTVYDAFITVLLTLD